MKKRILAALLAALLLTLTLAGCKKKAAVPFSGMTTEQIVEAIYKDLPEGTELPNLGSTAITKENVTYYIGTEDVAFTEGTASEPLINAIAYSLCVFRLAEGQDAADAVAKIKANVNPNKWICVGVDEQNVVVDSAGDVVILIMADGAETLHEAFSKLAGK